MPPAIRDLDAEFAVVSARFNAAAAEDMSEVADSFANLLIDTMKAGKHEKPITDIAAEFPESVLLLALVSFRAAFARKVDVSTHVVDRWVAKINFTTQLKRKPDVEAMPIGPLQDAERKLYTDALAECKKHLISEIARQKRDFLKAQDLKPAEEERLPFTMKNLREIMDDTTDCIMQQCIIDRFSDKFMEEMTPLLDAPEDKQAFLVNIKAATLLETFANNPGEETACAFHNFMRPICKKITHDMFLHKEFSAAILDKYPDFVQSYVLGYGQHKLVMALSEQYPAPEFQEAFDKKEIGLMHPTFHKRVSVKELRTLASTLNYAADPNVDITRVVGLFYKLLLVHKKQVKLSRQALKDGKSPVAERSLKHFTWLKEKIQKELADMPLRLVKLAIENGLEEGFVPRLVKSLCLLPIKTVRRALKKHGRGLLMVNHESLVHPLAEVIIYMNDLYRKSKAT
jgi:hypothetical protein